MPIAAVNGVNTATPTVYYVHTDHLMRPARMVAQNWSWVWDVIYAPFGGTAAIFDATAKLDMRFPGQWFQLESGLAYNWHRHYDATLGRYVQPDPIGLKGGRSLYGYVGQNPLAYVDPAGLETAVVINNNGLGHAGVFTGDSNCACAGNRIFDPAGTFKNNSGNRDNEVVSGTSLNDYINFQRQDGSRVRIYRFNTDKQTEAEINSTMGDFGECFGGFCASCVQNVLRGIGPFGNLGSGYVTPRGLGNQIENCPACGGRK